MRGNTDPNRAVWRRVRDCIGDEVRAKVKSLQEGEILLLENVRYQAGEEANNSQFAEKLAELADVYVNDAFGTAHRAHASTVGITKFVENSVAGLLMEKELEFLGKALNNPERPFVAILGGAKVSDKIPVIKSLIKRKVDKLLIGGAMAYTFFKAHGYTVGKSLVEEDKLDLAKELIQKAKAKGVELHLPIDSVVADKFDANANTEISNNNSIKEGWMGLDIGPQARVVFSKVIEGSKTILWNGPMGVFEMKKFEEGTKSVAEAIVRATAKGGFSLIGGGDSAAAIAQLGFSEKVSYVSTGGGALLEYFEGKVLPGVKALE